MRARVRNCIVPRLYNAYGQRSRGTRSTIPRHRHGTSRLAPQCTRQCCVLALNTFIPEPVDKLLEFQSIIYINHPNEHIALAGDLIPYLISSSSNMCIERLF